MEYRPKRLRTLTPEQLADKRLRDDMYEFAVACLSTPYYEKKRTVGVTSEEEAAYKAAKAKLWDEEKQRRIDVGFYEEVDRLEELREAKLELEAELARVDTSIVEEEKGRGIRL